MNQSNARRMDAYHFKGVQFFLDLLCEHWRQAVACGDLSAAVILGAGPGVVKLDAWAEGDGPRRAVWRRRHALCQSV